MNFDKKTVKLGSTVSASPKLSSKLDKLSLSKNKLSGDPNTDSPEKKVKLNYFDKNESENLKTKTIQLINKQIQKHDENPMGEKSQKQPSEKSQDKSTQEVKKIDDSPQDMDTSENVSMAV